MKYSLLIILFSISFAYGQLHTGGGQLDISIKAHSEKTKKNFEIHHKKIMRKLYTGYKRCFSIKKIKFENLGTLFNHLVLQSATASAEKAKATCSEDVQKSELINKHLSCFYQNTDYKNYVMSIFDAPTSLSRPLYKSMGIDKVDLKKLQEHFEKEMSD